MIDYNKTYTLDELINLYNMDNIDFKFYGNNNNGSLEFYMKTDADKVSVFKSIDRYMSKMDYIKLSEDEARKLKFKFDREVNEVDLDIVAIVLRTSDINIPSGRYTLETLDKLTQEQDLEKRDESEKSDGIAYLIVDNNTACPLYDNVYLFGKNEGGLINQFETEYETEKDSVRKDNLNIILKYYNNLKNDKKFSI